MARKRYITTDISLSRKIEELARRSGEYAVLLFTWLVPHADDWGRLEGDADKVFFTVTPRFALLGRTPDDVEDALTAMHDIGLLTRYEVNGSRYIQLNPDTFYELQTYIPKTKREQDQSAFPPSPSGAGNPAPSSTECYLVAQGSAESQQVAQNTPSPSPSPSLVDVVVRAREAEPVDNSGGAPIEREVSDDDVALVAREYSRTFVRSATPIVRDQIVDWLKRFAPELIIEALRRTAAGPTNTWAYCQGILRNWDEAHVQNMADLVPLDEAFKAKHNGARSRAAPVPAQSPPEPPPPKRIDTDPVELARLQAEAIATDARLRQRLEGVTDG